MYKHISLRASLFVCVLVSVSLYVFVFVFLCISVSVCVAGHMGCCCGRYFRWVTIRIRQCKWKTSSSCCKMDIACNDHRSLGPTCTCTSCWFISMCRMVFMHTSYAKRVLAIVSAAVCVSLSICPLHSAIVSKWCKLGWWNVYSHCHKYSSFRICKVLTKIRKSTWSTALNKRGVRKILSQ